jgi:hypothetical protein
LGGSRSGLTAFREKVRPYLSAFFPIFFSFLSHQSEDPIRKRMLQVVTLGWESDSNYGMLSESAFGFAMNSGHVAEENVLNYKFAK